MLVFSISTPTLVIAVVSLVFLLVFIYLFILECMIDYKIKVLKETIDLLEERFKNEQY